VDIAKILGISPRTLVRQCKEFDMPIGADAFTCIDLDEHVRRILRINPEAGTVYPILHNINTVFNA
jgi:predicted P-loop ATPase/GTPase